MKTILFSRVFPATHPRKGMATTFSQQIHNGQKIHTIRKNQRWAVGDTFEPREWSGAPYRSHQRAIGDPLTVTASYFIGRRELGGQDVWMLVTPKGGSHTFINPLKDRDPKFVTIAANDGLALEDFVAWFPETFQGQIICWTDDPYRELLR